MGSADNGNGQVVKSEQALVPVPPAGLVELYNPEAGTRQAWCNWSLDTDEGRVLASRCMGESTHKADKLMNVEFDLVRWWVHVVQVVSAETGEVLTRPRTVLMFANGETVGMVSEGVRNSLATTIGIWGPGPWEPPLRCRLIQINTRAGRRTYNLEVLGRAVKPVEVKEVTSARKK